MHDFSDGGGGDKSTHSIASRSIESYLKSGEKVLAINPNSLGDSTCCVVASATFLFIFLYPWLKPGAILLSRYRGSIVYSFLRIFCTF
jgi:hypothetical protein